MATFICLATPPDVAVTVTLDGPFCVDIMAVEQPTNPAEVITSNASARYTGRPRKAAIRCCFVSQRIAIPARAVTGIRGMNGVHGSCRREDGGRLAVVEIVSTVEAPLGLPFVMVVGFSAQVAPESPAGNAQVRVTSAGKAMAGVVVTFNVTVAGVPAVTETVPVVA